MDSRRFDTLARNLGNALSRRSLAAPLGGLLAVLLSGAVPAAAKKKKKKKKPYCLDGQTIKASKKKKKKLLKRGATPGACPPVCTPTCSGTTCGGDDGCGGVCGCATGSLCHEGSCQPCAVTCEAVDRVCAGTALQARLELGGTVYVCPGRYVGGYVPSNVTVIGAGAGDDPASSTILDANGSDRAMFIAASRTVSLHGLRLTGGSVTNFGGGVRNEGALTMTDCTITGNKAMPAGGGLSSEGPLTLTRCQVTGNTTVYGGGVYVGSSTATLARCVVSQNMATDGGGIYLESNAVVRVNDGSQITGNNAGGRGGGLYSNGGTVEFAASSSVTNNTSSTPPSGIADFGSVTLNGATVSGNTPPPQCSPSAGCP